MTKKRFGDYLKKKRIEKEYSLRQICTKVDYDFSNWSKIERGIMSPPADENVLKKWSKALGLNQPIEVDEFIEFALISQNIIPESVMSNKNIAEILPAFFRTLRNSKPTKDEIDKLIEIIKKS